MDMLTEGLVTRAQYLLMLVNSDLYRINMSQLDARGSGKTLEANLLSEAIVHLPSHSLCYL